MSRRERVNKVIKSFGAHYGQVWGLQLDGSNIANALREAVEGLNIEPSPERELSIEKHHFIRGQNWVKDAILHLADEIDLMEQEQDTSQTTTRALHRCPFLLYNDLMNIKFL